MTKTTKKFKNYYDTIGIKPESHIKYKAKDMTDQSQLASASISEMAKKFGIEALKSKAEKTYIDSLQLQNQLFGHDFTKMNQSKEELLNIKRKLTNMFNCIPAGMRKELFQDNIHKFLETYTSNDEVKLQKLVNVGLVSESQYNQVVTNNNKLKAEKIENEKRESFIKELEKQKEGIYETFKKTGNINFTDNQNNAADNPSI